MIKGSISEFGEEKIIALANDFFSYSHKVNPNVIKGIGDDAAVIKPLREDFLQLITVDTIVENTHFTSDTPPEKIGRKAMAVNISDIAAMGGLPTVAVISAALPKSMPITSLEKLIAGINEMAELFDISIVGGDTVRAKNLSITITLLGKIEKKENLCLRNGLKPGNIIAVTGKLGGSFQSDKHLNFSPRLNEARWLVENMKPTAMMDLSDGLAHDSLRMAKESNILINFFSDKIPITKNFNLNNALFDGEDFELLCGFDKQVFTNNLKNEFEKKFNLKLSIVGEVREPPTKVLLDNKILQIKSFNHFKK